MAGEPEFSKIVVEADYECFLWAAETSDDDNLVCIEFDVLARDVPQDLMDRFGRWYGIWEKAYQRVFKGAPVPDEFAVDQFHTEGQALAQELATIIGQPVEYR